MLRAEPDEAMLWITLTALESDAGDALTDVSRRSEAFVALLDELGVAKEDRSTTGVTVYEEFDHTRSGRRSLGHRAAASVSARFTNSEPIGRLIARATTELQARIDGPRGGRSPQGIQSALTQLVKRPPPDNARHKPSLTGSGRSSDGFSNSLNQVPSSPGHE